VTFYGDHVKMCKDFDLNFGDKRMAVASCQCHLTLPFSPIFGQKQHSYRTPTIIFSVSLSENKQQMTYDSRFNSLSCLEAALREGRTVLWSHYLPSSYKWFQRRGSGNIPAVWFV
jgi:hypothetical protein